MITAILIMTMIILELNKYSRCHWMKYSHLRLGLGFFTAIFIGSFKLFINCLATELYYLSCPIISNLWQPLFTAGRFIYLVVQSRKVKSWRLTLLLIICIIKYVFVYLLNDWKPVETTIKHTQFIVEMSGDFQGGCWAGSTPLVYLFRTTQRKAVACKVLLRV